MDASDTIRRRKAAAVFFQKTQQLAAAQPAADCFRTAGQCSPYESCKITYKSYEEKELFKAGRETCIGCECDK
jgi:hypothetical protein